MGDLVENLRSEAKKRCERHNRIDQFDPAHERKPKDFIEWKAADEIERLTAENDAHKKTIKSLMVYRDQITAENERYREALQEFARYEDKHISMAAEAALQAGDKDNE